MKILLTGPSGFIGSYINQNLKYGEHLIVAPGSRNLNLTQQEDLKKFFEKQKTKFDLVIHTAIGGGSGDVYNPYNLNENIAMFYNLMKNKHHFKYLINLASGAEFDQSTDINAKTNNLFDSFPYTIYGMSKNIISRVVHSQPQCYNLRLYGCFGIGELDTRFIQKNIQNYIDSKPIEIYQDKYFDYFNLKDVLKVIKYYINCFEKNLPLEKDIDLVYLNKLKLSDIANIINNLDDKKSEVKINDPKLGLSYTGTSGVPYDIKFDGLEKGIRQMYNALKKA
ncbi:MAG: NAD-dependent epimerase/dehydratase family protein [Fusobacterium sp.]